MGLGQSPFVPLAGFFCSAGGNCALMLGEAHTGRSARTLVGFAVIKNNDD